MERENASAIRCGFGRQDITPPLGSPLVGYYRPRRAKGVISPLMIRAAMFEANGKKALVIAMDLCLMTKDLSAEIRTLAAERIGMDPDAILINLSHTHTGPLTNKDFASDTQADPNYIAMLKLRTVAAALEAESTLAPARLFYAKTTAEGISFIRRYRMKDGSTKTNPRTLDPNIDHPLGEPNEDLRLLKIVREGAEDLYLVHFGTHADTVGGEYVCADYPGFVCSILESAIPQSRCMFLLGPQGDANHLNRLAENSGIVGKGKAEEDPAKMATHARYMGRVIAGRILTVCDRAEEIPASEIRFGSLEVALPANRECSRLEEALKVQEAYLASYDEKKGSSIQKLSGFNMSVPEARRIIRMKDAPDFYLYSVYALRIGDFVFAGLPGEPFTEIGRKIYSHSPFETMMLCAQTNASCGYVGTEKAYDEGGYETLTSSYKKGTDKVLTEGMLSLLEQLKQ
ncbi:MAG: hypothetical protein IKJ74_06170 [Clostridia bacterium]|nr:hypothetical protein [Clostridia bacterium]